jgi:hypothetical protein
MKKLNTYTKSMLILVIIGVGVGLVLGKIFELYAKANGIETNVITSNPLVQSSEPMDVAISNPLPQNVEQLVASSDIIVIGKVGAIVNQEITYGYGEEAEELARLDQQTSTPLGLPVIDYEIIVEEIILGTDDFQKETSLIFRIPGSHNPNVRETELIVEGETKLLFLSANPDGKTYGVTSLMHIMTIEGQTIVYYNGGVDVIPFGATDALSFIVSVKNVAKN